MEESLVEVAAEPVGHLPIQSGRIADQLDCFEQPLCADLEFVVRVVEGKLHALAFDTQAVDPLLQLRLRDGAVCDQVDQAILLPVELLELRRELGLQLKGDLLTLGHEVPELALDRLDKVRPNPKVEIVRGDGLLDLVCREVRQVALAVLPASTQEVGVVVAGSRAGLGEDETRRAALLLAPSAEQHAFQVVLQDAVALPVP